MGMRPLKIKIFKQCETFESQNYFIAMRPSSFNMILLV